MFAGTNLQARVDHKNGTVHFGGLKAESDQIKDHIASLAQRLAKACAMISPAASSNLDAKRLEVNIRHSRSLVCLLCSRPLVHYLHVL